MTYNPALIAANPIGPAGGDLAGTYPDPDVDAIGGIAVTLAAGVPGDVLTQQAGGNFEPQAPAAGGVATVQQGLGIVVDATDPANPVVSEAFPIPTPAGGDAGKVVTVNGTDDGYDLAPNGGSSAVVATYDFDFTQAVALAAGVDTGIAIPANSLILSAAVRVGTAFDTSIAAVGLAEDQAGAVAAAASGFDGLITGGITVADTALNDCPHTLVANSAYNQTAGMTYTDALTEWWLALNMNAETPAAGAATVTIVYLPI